MNISANGGDVFLRLRDSLEEDLASQRTTDYTFPADKRNRCKHQFLRALTRITVALVMRRKPQIRHYSGIIIFTGGAAPRGRRRCDAKSLIQPADRQENCPTDNYCPRTCHELQGTDCRMHRSAMVAFQALPENRIGQRAVPVGKNPIHQRRQDR